LYLRRGWLAGVHIGRRWLVRRSSVEHLLRYGVPQMLPDDRLEHLDHPNLLEYTIEPAEGGSSSSSDDYHISTYSSPSKCVAPLAPRTLSWA
jgi:hypothetical protein